VPAWVWAFIITAGGFFALKLAYLLAIVIAIRTTGGALFTSTAGPGIRAFLEAVPMGPQDLLVDLGCGDGRVLREARKRCGVRALGFEVNAWAYLMARIRCGRDHGIEIRRADFWHADLSDASVVFCYLFPDVIAHLAGKLEAELRPGTLVVSANFPVPGWTPLTILPRDSHRHADPIYIYRMSAGFDTDAIGGKHTHLS
jgi:hypothetical protein